MQFEVDAMRVQQEEQPNIASQAAARLVALAGTRLINREGVLSIDGLDAAIRGFGVATVVLLSVLGYRHVSSESAQGTATFGNRSVKMRRLHSGLMQKNLRTCSCRVMLKLTQGRSCSVR